jgi:hypothetical protein
VNHHQDDGGAGWDGLPVTNLQVQDPAQYSSTVAALITGVLSALVALASALWAARTSHSIAKIQATTARELAESSNARLERERADQTRRKVSQYSEPLVRAAYDLQARLYNSLRKDYLSHLSGLGESEAVYAVTNTLFLFAEYLCWVEILRKETELLSMTESGHDRALATCLLRIDGILSSGDDRDNLDFRIYRGQQRAIGELLSIWSTDGRAPTCLGFAKFTIKLRDDADFAHWFAPLERDVRKLMSGQPVNVQRLRDLQAALIDLIELIDEPSRRFDRNYLQTAN